jgi:hypothetical protein
LAMLLWDVRRRGKVGQLSSTLSILPGVGDRVCDAFPGLAGNNDCVGRRPGHEENLMVPDFASDGCDGVAEGESALWIPGCRLCGGVEKWAS